jgi:UDP-glucose 4-epimerase
MWGAYDISRLTNETGWRPRPVREALHAYMKWIADEETAGLVAGPEAKQ